MTVDCSPPGLAVMVNELIGAVNSVSDTTNVINADPGPDAITEVIVGELGIVGTKYSFELSESCDVPATLDATTANL